VVRNPKRRQLTALELEIMKVLWESGPSTVQAVQARLPGERRLAYTTVQTMLNVLHRKGRVVRTLKNRAYQYRATMSRRKAAAQAICDMVDRLFDGSAESLVMSLIENRQLRASELARLARLVGSSKSEGGT
jgi:BlaI family transcriptional regulator, penicillinase repressor